MSCGIYRITLQRTNRHYVGQTINLDSRVAEHKRLLQMIKHHSPKLQNAWNKYGAAKFEFHTIETCLREDLDARESHWMKELDSVKTGFNCLPFPTSSLVGADKISRFAKKRTVSAVVRAQISKTLEGRIFTEKHLKNLARAGRKRMLVSSQRYQLAQWKKEHPQFGKDNNFFAHHHTAETRRLISEKGKGRVACPELCAKRSKNSTGEGNSQFGKKFKFYNNGLVNRKILLDEIVPFLKENPEFTPGHKPRSIM